MAQFCTKYIIRSKPYWLNIYNFHFLMEVDVCATGICYSLAHYSASLFTFHFRTKYIFWFQMNVEWQRCFCDNTYFNHTMYELRHHWLWSVTFYEIFVPYNGLEYFCVFKTLLAAVCFDVSNCIIQTCGITLWEVFSLSLCYIKCLLMTLQLDYVPCLFKMQSKYLKHRVLSQNAIF